MTYTLAGTDKEVIKEYIAVKAHSEHMCEKYGSRSFQAYFAITAIIPITREIARRGLESQAQIYYANVWD
ncbi:hypothetical protein LCGC14_1918830 [marine sediment metagenome]|uniref:Uncharacterized protein n=1 Tax=marine sediment metagenome TaxID=412755 RepID=A0A0F9FR76_9ZZZZ